MAKMAALNVSKIILGLSAVTAGLLAFSFAMMYLAKVVLPLFA